MLRFRVKVGEKHHISVRVYDSVKLMHAASKEIMGERAHPRDCALTIAPGEIRNGCIAYILLTYKYAAPHIIAHEASHAAFSVALVLGPGVDKSDESDERIAALVETIFKAIYRRIHA